MSKRDGDITLGAESKSNSYYLALKSIKERFEQGVDPTKLMNEMEGTFKIPMLNDEDYNKDNPEVIQLYREISHSRNF